MPVTAKLSQRFYQRLGDEITNELVDWFNAVDATYRADLHQLNETNYARFEAKLDGRVAELGADFEVRWAALDAKIDRVSAELRADFEQRWTALDSKIDRVSAELRADFEQRWTALDSKVDRVGAELRESLERSLKEQTRWMFVAWASLLIPIIGLWIRG